MDEIKLLSMEVKGKGFTTFLIANGERKWGGCLEKGANLDAPLPCMWEGDTEITPVYLDEETKAAILAKWAEVEA